jgi:hypothetical protein
MIGLLAMLLTGLATQQPTPKWRLVEEWRVGGEVDGPHSLGDVRGLGLLPGGGIVLLDAKDQQIHFLDAQGKPVRTVGRKGAGPGEFQRANGLLVTSNGQVIVNDPGNSRFTLLSATGDLLKTFPILNPWGYGFLWDSYLTSRDLVNEYVPIHRGNQNVGMAARRVWSADFARSDTLLPPACAPQPDPTDRVYEFRGKQGMMMMSIPMRLPHIPELRSPDGARWVGRHPEYDTIERVPPGSCTGDLAIHLFGPRVRIRTALRDSVIGVVRANAARYGAPVPDLEKIPTEYRPFDRLFLDAAGRLWVERWVSETADRFEVYDSRGVLIAEVASPARFAVSRPLIITRGQVLGFVPDEDDLLHLVSFRIVR